MYRCDKHQTAGYEGTCPKCDKDSKSASLACSVAELGVKLTAAMDEFEDTEKIVIAVAAHALVRGRMELAQRLMDCLE